jgi:hypothetical protein
VLHSCGALLALIALLALAPAARAQVPTRMPSWAPPTVTYDAPFFPDAAYDATIKTPEELLGFPLGSRPATHRELERCLFAWRDSPRMRLNTYARSHERRTLYYAVITSEENHARLEEIRAGVGKLADPRKLKGEAEQQRLLERSPAVAWLAYSIHGDELSSTDAAIAVMYHLVACTDPSVKDLLADLVVVVDPLMNPDGRDRFIAQMDQYAGYTPSLEPQALQHTGRWPWGRGNHYLFDLNRDWLGGVHPETRGRQKAIAEWQPQLLVDSHEMGSDDTYLFNPPREPINPNISPMVRRWWTTFAAEQAAAFDAHGWSYYTREWLEFWYPGYSDAWAALHGAVGILYEQAGTGGSPLRQPSGQVLTYREAVHHHVVSSMANLATLRRHRGDILLDFVRQKRASLAGPARSFVLAPGDNPTRERAFLEMLYNQGVEISVAQQAFTAQSVIDTLRGEQERREFPAGSYVIPLRQPAGPLVAAALDFDPRMTDAALLEERKTLESKRGTGIYDVTGWCAAMAYGVDGCWVDAVEVDVKAWEPPPAPIGSQEPAATARVYGYVIDGTDDASFRALAHLLQNNVRVRVAEKDFTLAGRRFGRGILLVRLHENDADAERRVRQAADASRAAAHPALTGRSVDDGPDLGGGHFVLLTRPRAALLGDGSVDFTAYGAIWRLFDIDVGLSLSLLNVHDASEADLRRYNVLILPPVYGDAADAYGGMVDDLKTWVKAGGTLIAIGNAAEPFVAAAAEFSGVRRRRDVLGELDAYATALELERNQREVEVDPTAIWDGPAAIIPPTSQPSRGAAAGQSAPAEDDEESDAVEEDVEQEPPQVSDDNADEALDEWRRVFSPTGVILRADVDREHWLTFGVAPRPAVGPEGPTGGGPRFVRMPVFFAGENSLLSKHPVQTPMRLADRASLRLSGLLWSESAERIADGAWATVERVGSGQVILFAAEPDFRGYWQGTRRLLINAVLLGPGCGTSQVEPSP